MSDSSQSLSPHLVSELMDAKVLLGKGSETFILDLPPGDKFPNIKEEIFRAVEGSFKTIGGETGIGIKTDEFNESIFHQLITVHVSSEREFTILAGYRYALWEGLMKDIKTPMTHFFDIQDEVVDPQHAKVIELGTAWSNPFINQRFQSIGFGNTWNGLAALVDKYKNDYFIGKLTIPAQYHPRARDLAINYLQNYALPPYCFNANPKAEYLYVPDIHDVGFSSRNRLEDKKHITAILNTPKYGNEINLPAMFPMYIPRLLPEKFHCIGTIQNGKLCETGIVTPLSSICSDVHESYKKSIEKFTQGFPNQEQVSLGDYLQNH